jgi:hypothetical protein
MPTAVELEATYTARLGRVRARSRIVNDFDNKPPVDATAGDQLTWMFDHPRVVRVVQGTIIAEDAYRDETGVVMTKCRMQVAAVMKGGPISEVAFETFGGKTNGFRAFKTHSPSCSLGEEAVAFLAENQHGLFAVGSDLHYPILRTPEGAREPWPNRVAAFLRNEIGGAQ